MSNTSKTYWVRAADILHARDCGAYAGHRYETREEAEQKRPESRLHTFEITVTDHGPATEPTWWNVEFGYDPVVRKQAVVTTSASEVQEAAMTFVKTPDHISASARVQAPYPHQAKAKAIDAWREAGFLPVLERAGLEVEK